MCQEYHALPVQAPIMLHKFLDTRTNDCHVLVVARVIYTANFYETPTEQLSEVLKTNIFARVVKNNAIC